MKTCICGNEVKPEVVTTLCFWEENYCSIYCRLYDERGLEKVNRGEVLKETGSKHYKNFKSFWDYPLIPSECITCGEELLLSKTKEPSKPYCSHKCSTKIHRNPKVRKAIFVFTMLRIMRHRHLYYEGEQQWVSGNNMYAIMQRMGGHPQKNPYSMTMRIWAKRGLLIEREGEYRDERGSKRPQKQYKFNPAFLEVPLGKAFYEVAGAKWE
jgi:hypothetical protein